MHLWALPLPPETLTQWVWWDPRICISNNFPDGVEATGLQTTVLEQATSIHKPVREQGGMSCSGCCTWEGGSWGRRFTERTPACHRRGRAGPWEEDSGEKQCCCSKEEARFHYTQELGFGGRAPCSQVQSGKILGASMQSMDWKWVRPVGRPVGKHL